MEGQQVTLVILTALQRNALIAAGRDHLGIMVLSSNRWRTQNTRGGLGHQPAVIDQLVATGLMRREEKHVRLTIAGLQTIAAERERLLRKDLPLGIRQIISEAEEPLPEITHNADGSIEFCCAGCGQNVFMAVDDGFGFPACFECRWFGEHPQLQKPEVRA